MFEGRIFTFLRHLSMAPSYYSSKISIVVAKDLYSQHLQGDESDLMPLMRRPISHVRALLDEPDWGCEARNVSALFLAHAWLNYAPQKMPSPVPKPVKMCYPSEEIA
ncbi:hypothetical protein A359_07910 [secondary endosymbiont of Ctenarytaina eucalypti]|uniref:Uncharacterized protein n=1 Tax=secondary endosymbiont of Ctenarytaina eucalypti TaxID=1199245 RepID=J3TXY1_9ENTR|nr:hypothetical protein A359_07910 [secondary endosymbiont of Ctenarytaina eucalypti]